MSNQETINQSPVKIRARVAKKNYDFLCDTQKRINLLCGGAGSTKSTSLAIYLLLERFYKYQNYRLVVARKTLPALMKSCWLLMHDLIQQYGLPVKRNKDKSNLTLKYGSNTIFFVSLDDVKKLKSIERINDVWVEEATETELDDFTQLNIRARGANDNGVNQLFLSYNPDNEMSYLREMTERPDEDTAVCLSTYLDNPYMLEPEIKVLEGLIKIDPAYHKIYALGQWASLKGSIYTNWEVCREWPDVFDDTRYGLDFGYNNPTALVEINYLDGVVYLRELLYESGLTNSNLIERLHELTSKSHLMIADCAEPDRIEEIYQQNYDVHACHKGVDSVRRGIDIVRSKTVYYHPDSDNLRKESNSYKWREDAKGNGLDEPVKFKDHLMDAVRYGISYDEIEPGLVFIGEEWKERGEYVLTMNDVYGEDWDDGEG